MDAVEAARSCHQGVLVVQGGGAGEHGQHKALEQ